MLHEDGNFSSEQPRARRPLHVDVRLTIVSAVLAQRRDGRCDFETRSRCTEGDLNRKERERSDYMSSVFNGMRRRRDSLSVMRGISRAIRSSILPLSDSCEKFRWCSAKKDQPEEGRDASGKSGALVIFERFKKIFLKAHAT